MSDLDKRSTSFDPLEHVHPERLINILNKSGTRENLSRSTSMLKEAPNETVTQSNCNLAMPSEKTSPADILLKKEAFSQ